MLVWTTRSHPAAADFSCACVPPLVLFQHLHVSSQWKGNPSWSWRTGPRLKTRKLIGRCIKTDVDKPSCTCMWILIHQWELGWKEKEKWWLTFLGEHLKKEALNARVFHQLELETPPGPEVKHLQELKPVLLLIFELNCRLTSQDEWEPQTTESSCTSSESLRQVIVFYWKKKNTVLFCQKWKNC